MSQMPKQPVRGIRPEMARIIADAKRLVGNAMKAGKISLKPYEPVIDHHRAKPPRKPYTEEQRKHRAAKQRAFRRERRRIGLTVKGVPFKRAPNKMSFNA